MILSCKCHQCSTPRLPVTSSSNSNQKEERHSPNVNTPNKMDSNDNNSNSSFNQSNGDFSSILSHPSIKPFLFNNPRIMVMKTSTSQSINQPIPSDQKTN